MKKCVSAVFWGCHSPGAIAAIVSAVNDGRLHIGAWFGNASECTHKLDPFIHQFKLDSRPNSSYPLVDQLEAGEVITFCDMYSRVSRSRGLSIQELAHTAHIYFKYFTLLLAEKQTELVIFSSPPHFGVDYLLYLAAQKMGIEAIFCYQTLFPNRFFFTRSIEDFGKFEDVITQDPTISIRVEKTYEKNLFYMQSIKTKPERALLSLINDIRRNLLRSSSKPMSLAGIIEKYNETRDWAHNNPNSRASNISLDTPYVYFPLQLQPEMTTSALGSRYSDQITALEVLNKLLPENWLIYVKENPKQTHRQRGAAFMQRLKAIPKVRYVGKDINTYELLRHSRFASTITGTVGWEAISGGKPALVFGNPWYKQLVGVVQYKTDIALDDIINVHFEHEALEVSLNNLLAKSMAGVIDPGYSGIVEKYNETENTKLIREFLNKAIEGKLFNSKHPQNEA